MPVMPVLGPLDGDQLGVTLTHEHLLIDVSYKFQPPSEVTLRALSEQPITLGEIGLGEPMYVAGHTGDEMHPQEQKVPRDGPGRAGQAWLRGTPPGVARRVHQDAAQRVRRLGLMLTSHGTSSRGYAKQASPTSRSPRSGLTIRVDYSMSRRTAHDD